MDSRAVLPSCDIAVFPWYAVKVRSHCEYIASAMLDSRGFERFLPLVRSRRRWSDRMKEIDAPLFPGYVFCRFDVSDRIQVLECAGVAGIVGFGRQYVPIPEDEIRTVRMMLQSNLHIEPHRFLQIGQKIRIERGPLTGVEGVIVEMKNRFRLVASVTLLQRSVSVEIEREWADPVSAPHTRPSVVGLSSYARSHT